MASDPPVAVRVGLLAAVAPGYFYAVEAAPWARALFAFGSLSGGSSARLRGSADAGDGDTGALFALFVAATTSRWCRAFGTDKLVADWVKLVPGSQTSAAIVLVVFALAAFVLDAFEIMFVIVPIVIRRCSSARRRALGRRPGAAHLADHVPGPADRLRRDGGARHAALCGVARRADARAVPVPARAMAGVLRRFWCSRSLPIWARRRPTGHASRRRSLSRSSIGASTTCSRPFRQLVPPK